jgi:hypothetical protein
MEDTEAKRIQENQTYMGLVKQLNDYNISDAYESLENVLENAD